MKIAARFPIKANVSLKALVYASHLVIVVLCLSLALLWWQVLVVSCISLLSLYLSIEQYERITNAPDDLCWSGENWLMRSLASKDDTQYMTLLTTSWITPHFCLLKFDSVSHSNTWYFSKAQLGERLFRELCYLARLDLKSAP
jgi:hypothetical protein